MSSSLVYWSPLVVAVAVACAHPPEAAAPEPASSAPAPASPTPDAAGATAPAAGTSPASDAPPGAAQPAGGPGATCGGIAGLRCGENLFCDFPPEAHCGAADQTGTCQPKPGCRMEDAPVCGCDDRTYPSACLAHANGVSVARDGKCAK